MTQLVQVLIGQGKTPYTYATPEGEEVAVGDSVQVPVSWGGILAGTVVKLGSDYTGPVLTIDEVIR